MTKKILVPLDGSKNSYRGLDEAINLARQCKAIIIGIHIKDVPGIYALHPIGFIGLASGKEAKKVIEHAKTVCAITFFASLPEAKPMKPIGCNA
jgi:nucleotide-binding universal stress UspA family protein